MITIMTDFVRVRCRISCWGREFNRGPTDFRWALFLVKTYAKKKKKIELSPVEGEGLGSGRAGNFCMWIHHCLFLINFPILNVTFHASNLLMKWVCKYIGGSTYKIFWFTPPPLHPTGPNSFIFRQFFTEKHQHQRPLPQNGPTPPYGKS